MQQKLTCKLAGLLVKIMERSLRWTLGHDKLSLKRPVLGTIKRKV